jgi:hypothetical protein
VIKRAAMIVIGTMFAIGTVFVIGCGQTSSPSSPLSPAPVASSPASENSTVSTSLRPAVLAQGKRVGFSLNGTVSGFPPGVVSLTGGGAYELASHAVHAGGGFRCVDSVFQPPLSNSINPDDPGPCLKDEGVRWDTAALLDSTMFKCNAAATPELATTNDHTVVLQGDFYRAGDGNEESFRANMIVSDSDISTHFPGVNIWVQGVGCGTAKEVNFAR